MAYYLWHISYGILVMARRWQRVRARRRSAMRARAPRAVARIGRAGAHVALLRQALLALADARVALPCVRGCVDAWMRAGVDARAHRCRREAAGTRNARGYN